MVARRPRAARRVARRARKKVATGASRSAPRAVSSAKLYDHAGVPAWRRRRGHARHRSAARPDRRGRRHRPDAARPAAQGPRTDSERGFRQGALARARRGRRRADQLPHLVRGHRAVLARPPPDPAHHAGPQRRAGVAQLWLFARADPHAVHVRPHGSILPTTRFRSRSSRSICWRSASRHSGSTSTPSATTSSSTKGARATRSGSAVSGRPHRRRGVDRRRARLDRHQPGPVRLAALPGGPGTREPDRLAGRARAAGSVRRPADNASTPPGSTDLAAGETAKLFAHDPRPSGMLRSPIRPTRSRRCS